jgi:uracil-DNA glycosylase family 4
MTSPETLNPIAALHVLLAHLEARARAGHERVWMSPDARAALKEICRMKPGRLAITKSPPLPPLSPQPAPGPAETIPPPRTQKDIAPQTAPAPGLTRAEKESRLADIASRAEASPNARGLGTLRDIMVFATGNPEAEIMFVGEAPGADEEKQREPFVGIAGQLLTRVIKAMGLERSDVYITNICKFRPATDDGRPQGTRNRQPTGTEMNACMDYVLEEIAVIQPKVIVALGKTAAEGLLQRDVAITRLRGQWLECRGIPLMPTFHPSYLKRKEDEGEAAANAEKRKHWEDMLNVMERLNMPISEKQRAFFLPRPAKS